jgi:hypothetical protein
LLRFICVRHWIRSMLDRKQLTWFEGDSVLTP